MFLYDNMIKGEQTEDGFLIVSTKQEPSLTTDVKTYPEEDDTEGYALTQQNIKSEIETDQQFINTDVKNEPEIENPDRCIVCNERLITANQNCDTESKTQNTGKQTATNSLQPQATDTRSTVRRNPSRSAKINILYHEDYSETDLKEGNSLNGAVNQCWKCKCSEIKTDLSDIETESWTMDQSDSVLATHDRLLDVLEHPSVREKRFKCNVCHKKFTHSSNLKRHVSSVHDKIKAFLCPHCPYKASQSSHIEKHILTHTGEKNYTCAICERKFALNSSLGVHIKAVHDKVRSFPCPHCPYKAGYLSNINSHILTHTREKSFKCDICDKTFTRDSSLKLHIKSVHDDLKAFECPHCPYRATRIDHLQNHILTHREKQFECDMCHMKFAQNSHVKRHIRTVHDKVKAFSCPHCPYKAGQRGGLKSHLLTQHGMSEVHE